MTTCSILTSPEGVEFAGWCAWSIPILSKERGSTEKHKPASPRAAGKQLLCFLLTNSADLATDTLKNFELQSWKAGSSIWKMQILHWKTGRAKTVQDLKENFSQLHVRPRSTGEAMINERGKKRVFLFCWFHPNTHKHKLWITSLEWNLPYEIGVTLRQITV